MSIRGKSFCLITLYFSSHNTPSLQSSSYSLYTECASLARRILLSQFTITSSDPDLAVLISCLPGVFYIYRASGSCYESSNPRQNLGLRDNTLFQQSRPHALLSQHNNCTFVRPKSRANTVPSVVFAGPDLTGFSSSGMQTCTSARKQ